MLNPEGLFLTHVIELSSYRTMPHIKGDLRHDTWPENARKKILGLNAATVLQK